MSEEANEIIFSFIIPVYNTRELLFETLDSINSQDYDLNKIQVIIVNDCSTDEATNSIIKTLKKDSLYKNFKIEVIENEKNMWLSETRNIGAKKAVGKYLVCLDSDDTINYDFLKLSEMAFIAYPNASWVYPSVRKFGFRNKIDIAPDFSSKNLFLENYVVAVSPLKKELWVQLKGQRTFKLNNDLKLYEDWDFWQRAIGKGYFGVPIKKVIFNYRQSIKSLITRNEDEGNLSSLIAYKNNWTSIFGLKKSQNKFNKDHLKHTTNSGLINKILTKLVKVIFKRNPKQIKVKDFILYLFSTKAYIKEKTNPKNRFTKAHKYAGFLNGFDCDFVNKTNISNQTNSTILFTHFWWHVGGAENILLEFMKLVPKDTKIIDLVIKSKNESNALKDHFNQHSQEQFALDYISEQPYPQLLMLWNIIIKEKPKMIFNMSNPLLYILSPFIKDKLPNTQIVDLLHCEEFEDNGWFEVAFQYQNHIDKRIVTSDYWAKVLTEKYNESSYKIKTIYNLINTEKFNIVNVHRNEGLNHYKINIAKKTIGFLGRITEQKKPQVFVELALMMQEHTDFHFIMVGSGDLLDELKPKFTNLSNFTYLPETKKPQDLYPLFDVAVFPSKYEGYPLVGIECAYLSKPIIASEIVGFKEQIENGNFGFTYQPSTIEDEAFQIKNILINQYDELIKLGKNGPEFVNQFHNREKISHQIIELFS